MRNSINFIYKLVWNKKAEMYVPVAESCSSIGKAKSLKLVALTAMLSAYNLCAAAPLVNELPQGQSVQSGNAIFTKSTDNATLNINQSTSSLITNWDSFNIGANATVNFIQPTTSSTALNRVTTSTPSQIYGNLNANGQVFLINSAGIYFSKNSRVDTGGFVASTLDISNENFLNKNYKFNKTDSITGTIYNLGAVTAKDKNFVAFISSTIKNEGSAIAKDGSVALLSGDEVTISFDPHGMINFIIDKNTVDAMIENKGLIQVNEGMAIVSAKAIDTITNSIIKNSGDIEANSLSEIGGRIILGADNITIEETSNIEATGKIGGGKIEIGGSYQNSDTTVAQAVLVEVKSGAKIDASAIENGDGGTISVWSDINNKNSITKVSGTLIAKSGYINGDGGKIETSGYSLNTKGITVNASSTNGNGGLWLLDPSNSTIDQATADGYVTTLNSGTSVTNQVNGDIEFQSDVTLNKSSGGDSTLTFDAGTNGVINLQSGSSITSNTGKLNLILSGAQVNIKNNIDANGGDISINATATTQDVAVTLTGATVKTSNLGTISINADSYSSTNTNGNTNGINFTGDGSIVETQLGSITLTGKGSLLDDSFSRGIMINSTSTSEIRSSSGDIILNDIDPDKAGNEYKGLFLKTGTLIGKGNLASSSSDIILNVDNMTIYSGTANNFDSSGTLSIQSYGDSFKNNFYLKEFLLGTDLSGITVGKSTNITNIYSYLDMSIAGNINIHGKNISIYNNITTTNGGYINLASYGGQTTQTHAITTDNLLLSGGTLANYTLENESNNFGTVAADAKKVYVTDSDGFTVGSVNGIDGITARWQVDLATVSGDLIINKNVSTTNSGTSAIILNAGQSIDAGNTAGGNIIINNNSTVTASGIGRVTFYTGSILGSTGLSDLIGLGTNHFRYGSDESVTNYDLALSSGKFGIYRESPTLTIDADDITTTYSTAPTLTTTVNGLQNNDTNIQALSTLASVNIGGLTSTSGNYIYGSHTLTASSAIDQLGYTLNYDTGTLNITKKDVITSGTTSIDKVYDGTTDALANITNTTNGGVVTGDIVTLDSANGVFNDKDVGVDKTVTFSGTYTGEDKDNYNFIDQTTTANITQKSLTITAIDDTKTYDGNDYASNNGVTYSGFVANEDNSDLSGVLAYSGDSQTANQVGTYAITPEGYTSNNYQINYIDGTLDISENIIDDGAGGVDPGGVDAGGVDAAQNTINYPQEVINSIVQQNFKNKITPVLDITNNLINKNNIFDKYNNENIKENTVDNLFPNKQLTEIKPKNTDIAKVKPIKVSKIDDKEVKKNIKKVPKKITTANVKLLIPSLKVQVTNNNTSYTPKLINTQNIAKINVQKKPIILTKKIDKVILEPILKNNATNKSINMISQNIISNTMIKKIKTSDNNFKNSGISKSNSQILSNTILKLSLKNSAQTTQTINKLIKVIQSDEKSIDSQLSSGNLPVKNNKFDKALQNALKKGYSPKEAVTIASKTNQLKYEDRDLSEIIRNLPKEKAQMLLNLLSKGYTQIEAINKTEKTVIEKETQGLNIVNGRSKSKIFDQSLANNIKKYGIEKALNKSLKMDKLIEKHNQIDKNNIATSFLENNKKGNVPNDIIFEKLLMKSLQTNSFEMAYKIAHKKYEKFKPVKSNSMLIDISQSNKLVKSKSKVWLKKFFKSIKSGNSDIQAQAQAEQINNTYNNIQKKGDTIDENIYKNYNFKD